MERQIIIELVYRIGFIIIIMSFGVLYLLWRLFKKAGNFRG